MRADVRSRIEKALARDCTRDAEVQPADLKQAIEEAMYGGREFSIDEIARKHGVTYHTVYRAVKGKPGYRVYGKKRGAKVSEALYRAFLADAIRRGSAG